VKARERERERERERGYTASLPLLSFISISSLLIPEEEPPVASSERAGSDEEGCDSQFDFPW
jgi:hypothetical protein